MHKEDCLTLMDQSSSELEWNNNCDLVKKKCGGKYPDYWYKEIVLSGLAAWTSKKWNGSADIKIISYKK